MASRKVCDAVRLVLEKIIGDDAAGVHNRLDQDDPCLLGIKKM